MLPCMAPELVTAGPTSWLCATRPWRRWWPRTTPSWPDNKVTENLERLKVEHVTYLECMEPVREFISKYQFSADRRIKTRLGFLKFERN